MALRTSIGIKRGGRRLRKGMSKASDARGIELGVQLNHKTFNGSAVEVGQILKNGADPNSFYHSGNRPLHLAVEPTDVKDRTAKVKLLLKAGANPNLRNSSGQTPLHIAANRGFSEVITALIVDGNAHINIKDSFGKTPFDYARNDATRTAINDAIRQKRSKKA